MGTSRLELNLWRAIAAVCLVLIALGAIRVATSKPGTSLRPVAGGLSLQKYKCSGPHGDQIGSCADTWWEHFWNDLSYCTDLKATCENGGGTWTTL
jgi:hypothetical protein